MKKNLIGMGYKNKHFLFMYVSRVKISEILTSPIKDVFTHTLNLVIVNTTMKRKRTELQQVVINAETPYL